MIHVAIGPEPLVLADAFLSDDRDGAGAIASFTGIVRGGNGLVSLELEHYPAMTEHVCVALAQGAMTRWSLTAVRIRHRVGVLVPGDPIVIVACASAHRAAALDACAFLIDRLKTNAPFWKRERFADGRCDWVEARAGDDAAAARWG